MKNLYSNLQKYTIKILIIFHCVKFHNTPTKINVKSQISIAYIIGVLGFLVEEGLLFKQKVKRETLYNYTFKGTQLFSLIDSFITNLNEEIKK